VGSDSPIYSTFSSRPDDDPILRRKDIDPILDKTGPLNHEEVASIFRGNPNHPSAVALKAWFGPSFRDLQEGKLPEQEALLNDLLTRLPNYASNKPLYRGIAFYNEKERNAFLAKLDGPAWSNERGFMSSTKKTEPAMRLAINSSYPVFLSIVGNRTGKDIAPFGFMMQKFAWQDEVLHQRGARFKVVNKRSIDMNGKVVYTNHLEEMR